MKPPFLKRRCQRLECPNWIELDPYDPEHTNKRYCSHECEHADQEPHPRAHSSEPDALSRLREALSTRADHSAFCSLQARPATRKRMSFLWVDCLSRQSGHLATVSEAESEVLMFALLRELNRWKKEVERKAKGEVA